MEVRPNKRKLKNRLKALTSHNGEHNVVSFSGIHGADWQGTIAACDVQ